MVDNGLFPIKKVDKDSLCIFQYWTNLGPILLLAKFLLFLNKPRSFITVDLIFYAPNVANLGFLMIVLTIAL